MGSVGAEVVAIAVAAECGCCGMWEECTAEYIGRVKERFGGVWVCGLCAEAIKDEQARLGGGVGVEAAVRVHAKFRQSAAADPSVRIARSLLRLFKKMMVSSGRTGTAAAAASAAAVTTATTATTTPSSPAAVKL